MSAPGFLPPTPPNVMTLTMNEGDEDLGGDVRE